MSAELAQTFLTVMRGTEVNRAGDETNVGVPLYQHVPAGRIETSKTVFDRASQARRTVRVSTCVVAGWADIQDGDTLMDELTGDYFLLEAMVRQPVLNGSLPDLILTLRQRTGVTPGGG